MRLLKNGISSLIHFTPFNLLLMWGLIFSVSCTKPIATVDSGDNSDSGGLSVFGGSEDAGEKIDSGDTPIVPTDSGNAEEDAGQMESDAGLPQAAQVGLEAISPPNGNTLGGYRVRIYGFGFSAESKVFFGENEAQSVLYIGDRSLTAAVPASEIAGPVTVKVSDPNGDAELEAAFTYFFPIKLSAISPRVGPSKGDTLVEVEGLGFHAGVQLLLNARPVVALEVLDTQHLRFRTPRSEVAGRVDLRLVDAFTQNTLLHIFEYVDALSVTSITPNAVSAGLEQEFDVYGKAFDADTKVFVNNVEVAIVSVVSAGRIRVRVPALAVGSYDVKLEKSGDIVELKQALVVFPEPSIETLQLTSVLPNKVDPAGGKLVHLYGSGFMDIANNILVDSIKIGTDELSSFSVLSSHEITFNAPAHALGNVEIKVHRTLPNDSEAVLNGFEYKNILSLTTFSPDSGPVMGGTLVNVEGTDFAAGLEILIGGRAVTDLNIQDTAHASFMTPIGAAGLQQVELLQNGEKYLAEKQFYYESSKSVLGVLPSRGGISGGTFVHITGQGFEQGVTQIVFGQSPMTEYQVISDSEIVGKTPPSVPGLVDVKMTIAGEEVAAISSFTYFDPTFLTGGTRGGPIEGAIYVTALDSYTGFPIPDLLVFLGTEGDGRPKALTNPIGQATLSGDDIYGAQTVTVAGDGYQYATMVDLNASEVTFYLRPLNLSSSSGNGGTPAPPPPPATIRGRVYGFAKEFFDPAALTTDEIALAFVTTSARDEFSGTPNPGGDNVVFEEGGEYFISYSRPGRLALIAIAGIYNTVNNEFRMRQMGVLRSVYPEFGVNLEDYDIELNIALDKTFEISLPEAPLNTLNGPTVTRVTPYLHFGGEGTVAYTTAVQARRNHSLEAMPDVPGELMTFIAGSYRTDGTGMLMNDGQITLSSGDRTAVGQNHLLDFNVAGGNGQPFVNGAYLVVERENGEKWASEIINGSGVNSLWLKNTPDFSESEMSYHIGRPGTPSSIVRQDGAGSLLSGITIEPFLDLPKVISPLENGVLGENRILSWKAAEGIQPSIHQMYVYNFGVTEESETMLWLFNVDGLRKKVPIPRIPLDLEGLGLESPPQDLPAGGYIWQHQSILSPGLSFDNWSDLDLGLRSRRAWTTDQHRFVYGG